MRTNPTHLISIGRDYALSMATVCEVAFPFAEQMVYGVDETTCVDCLQIAAEATEAEAERWFAVAVTRGWELAQSREREAGLREALEREAMNVSMDRTWCRICRTEHRSLDPKRVHPHDARCPLFRAALAPAPEARKAPAVRYPTKEQNRNWQCSGCRWAFAGPWQKVCPACGREDYWTGSVEPHATVWPHGTSLAPATEPAGAGSAASTAAATTEER